MKSLQKRIWIQKTLKRSEPNVLTSSKGEEDSLISPYPEGEILGDYPGGILEVFQGGGEPHNQARTHLNPEEFLCVPED